MAVLVHSKLVQSVYYTSCHQSSFFTNFILMRTRQVPIGVVSGIGLFQSVYIYIDDGVQANDGANKGS